MPNATNSYSPLWLRFSFLPAEPVGVAVFGVGWAVLFWLSQAFLPAPRTRSELRLTLLIAASSLTAFAIERGNIDLVIFLLALLGSQLWRGPLPLRLLGYAVFLLAGMLKFYPLVLLMLTLRERPRVFLGVTVVSTLIIAVGAYDVRDELAAVSRNIPTGSYFTDLFGSVNLPHGLPVLAAYIAAKTAGHPQATASFTWMVTPAYGVLLGATLFSGIWLAFYSGLSQAIVALSSRRRAPLLVGAALLCGCFFAGQSIGYRGILLLLVLPGLLELRRTLPPIASGVTQIALYAMVFVAWVLTIEFTSKAIGITYGYSLETDGFGLLHWVLHECCWWFIITVLLATLMSWAASSSMGEWARMRLPRRASQALSGLPPW